MTGKFLSVIRFWDSVKQIRANWNLCRDKNDCKEQNDPNSATTALQNKTLSNLFKPKHTLKAAWTLRERLLSCWKRTPRSHTAPSVVKTDAPMICHGSRSAQRALTWRRPSSRYSSTISLYTSKALCKQAHADDSNVKPGETTAPPAHLHERSSFRALKQKVSDRQVSVRYAVNHF